MIGDDIAAVLPELRAQAESMMRDRVVIVRPVGVSTDPDTGQVTTSAETVYEGIARLRNTSADVSERTPDVGGGFPTATTLMVHTPAWSPMIRPGDVVTVLASDTPALVGLRFRATQRMPQRSGAVQCRIPVEEVV